MPPTLYSMDSGAVQYLTSALEVQSITVLGVYQCRLESAHNIFRNLTVSSQRFAWRIGRFSNEMQNVAMSAPNRNHSFLEMKTPDCLISHPTNPKIAFSRFHLELSFLVAYLSPAPELPLPPESSKLGSVLSYRGFHHTIIDQARPKHHEKKSQSCNQMRGGMIQ